MPVNRMLITESYFQELIYTEIVAVKFSKQDHILLRIISIECIFFRLMELRFFDLLQFFSKNFIVIISA